MNSKVFFLIQIGQKKVGRVVMQLRNDVVPTFTENFCALCTGEKGLGAFSYPLHYKGTKIPKVVKGRQLEGGDIHYGGEPGGENIYFKGVSHIPPVIPKNQQKNINTLVSMRWYTSQYMDYPKAAIRLPHTKRSLSMCHNGEDKFRSKFFITFNDIPEYDNSFAIIGKVIEDNDEILDAIERCGSLQGKVSEDITIIDCGEVKDGDNGGASTSS